MRVAITGATGLVGRHILFEILKRFADEREPLEIFILGRGRDHADLADRVAALLRADGAPYLGRPPLPFPNPTRLHCIPIDLCRHKLGDLNGDLHRMARAPIDLFFHSGGATDLMHSPRTRERVEQANFLGTERILDLARALRIRQFCYIGSAYSAGHAGGCVQPDDTRHPGDYRNPYERTKMLAERAVRRFARDTGGRCRFFRPSVVCGRLIEQPLGAISKFDVFYGFGAFFARAKARLLGGWQGIYDIPASFPIRFAFNPRGALNIVPADFAAKAMVEICLRDDPAESYHITNPADTAHGDYLRWMLDALGITDTQLVELPPTDPSPLEARFYRTVGRAFLPYVTAPAVQFDMETTDRALTGAPFDCPPIDRARFALLMAWAKKRHFGQCDGPVAQLDPEPIRMVS